MKKMLFIFLLKKLPLMYLGNTANKFRFQIILRSEQSTALIRSIKKVKSPLCEIDMDPIEFT